MNVFSKRPLSLILCIALGVFYIFSSLKSLTAVLILIGALILGIVLIFFVKPAVKHRALVIAITVAVLIPGLFGQLYFKAFFPDFGIDKEITALVTEINEDDYYYSVTLKCESIDGKRASNKLLYNRSKSQEEVLAIGDRITLRCTLSNFKSSENLDTIGYYVGKGYSASVHQVSELEIVSHDNYVFTKVFTDMRARINERFRSLCNEDAAGLLSALVLGERDGLDAKLKLGFSRIGITHILALSGMHIAILCAAVSRLLSLLHLNKKIRIILTSLFTIAYMLLTGMPYSVVRAGVMLLISSLLFLLSLSRDSFTALATSVFLIILFQPYAIYDISLTLSALATLGILVYSEYAAKRKSKKESTIFLRILTSIGNPFFASVFAVGTTYLITALRFSFFSTIAVFSTVVFSFIIEIFVYIGLLMLALGAAPISPVVNGIYEFIEGLTNLFSSFKYASISYSLPFIRPLIVVFSILLLLFFVLRIKRKRAAVGVLLLFFCGISVLGIAESAALLSNDEFTVHAVENADVGVITGNGEACIVYSGSHSENSAALTASTLYLRGITYVDKIVINNYASGLNQYLDALLGDIRCDYIYLPVPQNDEELERAAYAKSVASVRFYKNEEAIALGGATFHHLLHDALTDNSKVQNVYTIRTGDCYSTYVSSGYTERAYLLHPIIYETDALIIGSHGLPYGKNYEFDLQLNNIKAIYFLAEIKLDERTRDFYNKKGVPIYD